MDLDVMAASEFYKEFMLQIAIAQREVLEKWTPATCVPEFDSRRAAGNAGHWNNLPTNQTKGGKKERKPPLTAGQPDHNRFEAFLRSRKTEDNETLRGLVSARESQAQGVGRDIPFGNGIRMVYQLRAEGPTLGKENQNTKPITTG
jgi:hypothetical protein